MGAKIKVVYTRSVYWTRYSSDKLDLTYVPLMGKTPTKKTGRPAGPDGHYLRADPAGIKQLIRTLKEVKPQVFLRWPNSGISKHDDERIRDAAVSAGAVTVMTDGNEPGRVCNWARKYKNMVDVFLITSRDPANYKRYRQVFKHVDTLYDGFNPRECLPPSTPTKFDCFFAGSNRRKRTLPKDGKGREWKWDFPGGKFRFEFISAVQRNVRKLRLHASPGEWPMPKGFAARRPLRYPDFFRAFHSAKIVLGSCHYPDIPQFYTRRLIYNGASGRLVITRYVKGMEKDFEESGRYIVWFKSIAEGLDKISHYLSHEEEREQIAARCKQHFLKYHTWEARLREFEKIVEKIL